ncbi:gp22 [Lomovskayavirus C31]|uniref:Gp22 n=1 Tax=Streptomyces phage phiC31 TaxID=10719 RepID=Q9ZX86_BPPHC|nr:gp22 [Lomovskayavirus C31]CAA07146.1 gp22 [Lomovskayavirus C31]
MPHSVPFDLSLSVWVPSGAARAWLPCSVLGGALTDELIQSCDELKAVFKAHGKLVARLLSSPSAPRYDGFRIIGRRKDTGAMVAAVEWVRSRETRELVRGSVIWTACKYVHPATALVA